MAALVAALLVVSFGPTADADEVAFRVPGWTSGEPGSTVLLREVDVPAELIGRTCELSDIILNNASVHPGNDMIVSTGDSVVVFENYEDAAFKITEASGPVELGPTIKFELKFGPDGITSKGHTFTVMCAEVPTTSTTAPPTPEPSVPTTADVPDPLGPTTTAPATTEPAPTTTEPAPTTTEPAPTTTEPAPTTTSTTSPPPLGPAPDPDAVVAQPNLAG